MTWQRRSRLAIGLVCSLVGCRHAESGPGSAAAIAGNPAAVLARSGDPSTNVMIVPASAAPGYVAGANSGRNQYPFPEYDQRVVRSVYDQWQRLMKDEGVAPQEGKVAVEFNLTS